VPTFSFPSTTFVIEGDPEAVRESGRAYGRFATVAGEAATDLHRLDSAFWVGSEGDAFRARLGDIPPHLDVAHGAFAQVATALDGFADVLASAQGRMAGVRADAEQTFSSLARARADRPEARVDPLEGAWDDQLSAAAGLRAEVLEAAQRAAVSIRAAARRSPTADQGWLAGKWEDGRRWVSDRVDDLRNFVAEHASGLRMLAKVLRWVGMALVAVGAVLAALSFVAGVFSFGIGWLGEIPAGAVLGAGMILWGVGDTIDTTVDWAEGRISGREFAFRAGFAVVTAFAGGVVVKAGGKVLDELAPRVGENLRRWVDDIIKPTPSREELIDELVRQGVKHTPENIVAIGRDPGGRIVFLETGSPSAGLEHILLKKHQFAQRGVGEDQVADYVFTAVTKGKVVGMQNTRPVYEFQWNGATHRVAVTVGDNGFIVGANPVG
jgi:hypothetical protein